MPAVQRIYDEVIPINFFIWSGFKTRKFEIRPVEENLVEEELQVFGAFKESHLLAKTKRNFLLILKQYENLTIQALDEIANMSIEDCKKIIMTLQPKKDIIELAFKVTNLQIQSLIISDLDEIMINIIKNFTSFIEAVEDKIFEYDYDNMTEDFFNNILNSIEPERLSPKNGIPINSFEDLFK